MSTPERVARKLAAVLSADVQGYSRLMGQDEVGTLQRLTACRAVTDALISQHGGRIVGTAGDGLLAEFASAVDAVQCAVEIQHALGAKNADLSQAQRMVFRIGINVGDVIVEGPQIYGDGVNIAARLEALADGGGICISGTVYDQVENKLSLGYEFLGEQVVKNIAKPVRVFRVALHKVPSPVEQASSLHAARMAAPLEGQGEGGAGKIESFKFHVSSSTSQEERSKPRRVGTARRWWVVVGLVFVTGMIVTARYFSLPTPGSQHPAPSPQSPLSTQDSAIITQVAPALPLPDKPSIVVLPFVNISDDPGQEYFSDGLTEDLTSELSKVSSLFVIARNSAFTYKGRAVKVQEIGTELGVRYVLEGSVRRADTQVRVIAQLVDAGTGHHLWSERYDRTLTDIFALQDEIRQKIITALRVKLTREEQERFQRAPTANLEAYDYYLRGTESYLRLTPEAHAQAREMFEKAIALDPQYAAAYAFLGFLYTVRWVLQWSQDPQTLEQGLTLAQQALALDASLSVAHRALCWTYAWKKQHDLAIDEGLKAIALDPNDADSYNMLSQALSLAGKPEEAIGFAEKAMRLNPHYPSAYISSLGWAYGLLGRDEEAIVALRRGVALNPDWLPPHLFLAAIYSKLGREEEARTEVAEMLRINPNFSLESFRQRVPYKDPAVTERFVAALRQAGLK
jgi:adenylate cyclase